MIVGLSQISGYLAMWAVRQSPYIAPDHLGVAVEKFQKALPLARLAAPMEEFTEIDDERALRTAIDTAIHAVPEIVAWNSRKNGHQAPYNFISRYDGPRDPDGDFIDLGALAGNASRDCWREMTRDAAFDADFDRRWNSWSARWGRFTSRMRRRFA